MSKNRQNYPNFHQRAKIIRIFELTFLFGRDNFSNFFTFSEKRKNSHKMGPKPQNYLKITENFENNSKLIKKEIEIEFGTYL